MIADPKFYNQLAGSVPILSDSKMRRAFFEAGAVFRSMGRALNDAASTLPSESPFTSSGHRPVMNLAKKV